MNIINFANYKSQNGNITSHNGILTRDGEKYTVNGENYVQEAFYISGQGKYPAESEKRAQSEHSTHRGSENP